MGELSRLSSLLGFLKDRALPSAPTTDSVADLLRVLEKRAISGAAADSLAARTGILVGGTTVLSVIRPSLADATAVTSGAAAWSLGAWVQFAAANDLAAHALIAIAVFQGGAGSATRHIDLEVGEGAAGAEAVTWRTTFFVTEAGTVADNQRGIFIPVIPALRVTANARVAVRVAANVASLAISVKLVFAPRPM